MSDSSGLEDVSTGLENSVLNFQVKFLGNSYYRRAIINAILLIKNIFWASLMTFRLVILSYSLPEGEAV